MKPLQLFRKSRPELAGALVDPPRRSMRRTLLVVCAGLLILAGATFAGLLASGKASLEALGKAIGQQDDKRPNVMLIADFSGPYKASGDALGRGFEDGLAATKTGALVNLIRRDDRGTAEALDALSDGASNDFRILAAVGPVERLGLSVCLHPLQPYQS